MANLLSPPPRRKSNHIPSSSSFSGPSSHRRHAQRPSTSNSAPQLYLDREDVPSDTLPITSLDSLASGSASRRAASRIFTTVRSSFSRSKERRRSNRGSDPNLSEPGMYSTAQEREGFRFPASASAAPPTVEQIAMGLHVSRTPHLRPARKGHRHLHSRAPPSSPSCWSDDDAPHHHHQHQHRDSDGDATPPQPPPLPRASTLKPLLPAAMPSRSSLKKGAAVAAALTASSSATMPHLSSSLLPGLSLSVSTTTMTSDAPSTPSTRSALSLRARVVSKLLPPAARARLNFLSSPSSQSAERDSREVSAAKPQSPRKAVRFLDRPAQLDEELEELEEDVP